MNTKIWRGLLVLISLVALLGYPMGDGVLASPDISLVPVTSQLVLANEQPAKRVLTREILKRGAKRAALLVGVNWMSLAADDSDRWFFWYEGFLEKNAYNATASMALVCGQVVDRVHLAKAYKWARPRLGSQERSGAMPGVPYLMAESDYLEYKRRLGNSYRIFPELHALFSIKYPHWPYTAGSLAPKSATAFYGTRATEQNSGRDYLLVAWDFDLAGEDRVVANQSRGRGRGLWINSGDNSLNLHIVNDLELVDVERPYAKAYKDGESAGAFCPHYNITKFEKGNSRVGPLTLIRLEPTEEILEHYPDLPSYEAKCVWSSKKGTPSQVFIREIRGAKRGSWRYVSMQSGRHYGTYSLTGEEVFR